MAAKKESHKKTENKNKADKPLSNKAFKIKIRKDGPYEVSGGVPLVQDVIVSDNDGIPYEWDAGNKYPTQQKYLLCRCGGSKNPPYCDGTHLHIDFDGSETASNIPFLAQAKTFEGEGLILKDADSLCAHAGFCDRAFGIWTLVDNSQVPDARDTAIEEAGCCPSGRLVVWDKDGKEIEPKLKPDVGVVIEDPVEGLTGALWVRGGIPIESSEGTKYEVRNRVTLCRCGKSSNKPFCDGTHYDDVTKIEKIKDSGIAP